MSRTAFVQSRRIEADDYPFYTVLLATSMAWHEDVTPHGKEKLFRHACENIQMYDMHRLFFLANKGYSGKALLFASIRQADDKNLELLEEVCSEAVKEFRKRYNAPGGYLPGESVEEE